MRFLTAAHTDIGIKKNTNQDSVLVMEAKSNVGNVLLAVICDGMGGLAKGEVASSATLQMFSQWFERELPTIMTIDDPKERIYSSWEKIVYTANKKIAEYGRGLGISLGTTVVAMLFLKDMYYVVNVGDSRAYQLSNQLVQITKDQTFVQREMDLGNMTYEEAQTSPKRNVLLQCIGASNVVEPAFYCGEVMSGQNYMLCSDGFRHVVTDAEIYERLNPYALNGEKAMMDNLVYLTELNKYRWEQDNISVLLVRVD